MFTILVEPAPQNVRDSLGVEQITYLSVPGGVVFETTNGSGVTLVLCDVFGKPFHSIEDARSFAHDPESEVEEYVGE